MTQFKFRSGEVEELSSFGALPDGKHRVKITAVDLRDTKKGGKRLVVTMTALEGDLTGISTSVGLNVICPGSPKAEAIARSHLKTLSEAVGRPDWDDANVLIGETCIANLKLKPETADEYTGDKYPASNEIRRWHSDVEDKIPFPSQAELHVVPEAPQAPSVPSDATPLKEQDPDNLPWNKE